MRAGALVLLAACGGSSSDKAGVAVELASVTLADDCGDYGYMPPPSKPPPDPKAERREAASQDVANESTAKVYRGCSQTSMQVSFSSDHAASVTVKKVELLDGNGKYIQDLTPRMPMRWNGSGYEKWDEKLEPTKPLSASYALAAPNWTKLGGRLEAQSKKYHLHVVIDAGGSDHSLDKQTIAPVVMQPDVVTLR